VFSEGQREQHSSDRGFTMVELVIALTVLAIGIVGVVGVMNSTFGVTARSNQRARAVSVATKEVEATRSVSWAQLTASTGQLDQHDDGSYHVTKAVTASADGVAKDVTVDVAWNDGAGYHDVRQSSKVYPGGLGPVGATATAASTGTLAPPSALMATVPTDNAGGTVVDLSWTNPIQENPADSSLEVVWSIDHFATFQTVTDSLFHRASGLRVTGLSAGTTYEFKVAALSAAGTLSSWSPVATVTTASAAGTACTYGTASVSPSAVRQAVSLWQLEQTVTVSVNTTGNCSGLRVTYQPNPASTTQTLLLTKQGGTGVWTATIPWVSGLTWSPGQHQLTLLDALQAPQGSLTLTVCRCGAPTCA